MGVRVQELWCLGGRFKWDVSRFVKVGAAVPIHEICELLGSRKDHVHLLCAAHESHLTIHAPCSHEDGWPQPYQNVQIGRPCRAENVLHDFKLHPSY